MKTSLACAAGALAILLSALVFSSGCDAEQAMAAIGSGIRVGQAYGEAKKEFTLPEQHYIGRGVAAQVVSMYGAARNPAAESYLNLLAQSLAAAADLPETYSGYHVVILDTDQIDAYAAPGGWIMVSRGLLRLARTEEEVAAVLAHELAHIRLQHGLRMIQGSRMKDVGKLALNEAGQYAGGDLGRAVELFQGSIEDQVHEMTRTGYSRSSEMQADAEAVRILRAAGYDAGALGRVLQTMAQQPTAHGQAGWFKTHPEPQTRAKAVGATQARPHPRRQARFQQALAGL